MHPLRMFAASVAVATVAGAAFAQAYPDRPIRWISPWPPGGSNDIFSRALAQKFTESMGQPVIVDNRPGAAGTVGSAYAAKQPGDGYTIVLGSSPTHAIAPSVYAQLPYDPQKDFAPVSFLGSVIRVRVALGKEAVSLDTFNSPASPPPKVGEKAEISFSPEDVLVLH